MSDDTVLASPETSIVQRKPKTGLPALPPSRLTPNYSLAELAGFCRANGYELKEVSREKFIQRLVIDHDAAVGKLTVDSPTRNIDDVQTLGVLWDALRLVARDMSPVLTSGDARVFGELRGNSVVMVVEPPHDPVVVKGLLVAMLCKLCEECEGEDFDPFQSLAGLIRFKPQQEVGTER